MYNVKQLVQHHLEIAPIVDKNTKPCSTAMLESSGETAPRVSARAKSSSVCDCLHQMVGIVPPSITYSLPVIDEARSDVRNATSSATSSGRFGRPCGIPPSESIMRCRAAFEQIPADTFDRNRISVHLDSGYMRNRTFHRHEPFTEVFIDTQICVRCSH